MPFGRFQEAHLAILAEDLGSLQEHCIRLNPAKCIFFQLELEFLDTGLTKTTFVSDSSTIMAMFLPKRATTLHPLHDLLQKVRHLVSGRRNALNKKQIQDSHGNLELCSVASFRFDDSMISQYNQNSNFYRALFWIFNSSTGERYFEARNELNSITI